MTKSKPKGTLIIIGGHEAKVGDRKILEAVAKYAEGTDKYLLVVTVASEIPEAVAKDYLKVFADLAVKDVRILNIRTREDAYNAANADQLLKAAVVFFTGGDQMRITSLIGASPTLENLQKLYHAGGVIVGTSAGAIALSETMLVAGAGDKPNSLSGLRMAPGLNLLPQVIIDVHFVERGRLGRLLSAVTQNPQNLGLGIDENTAVIFQSDGTFCILGTGAVYIIDGAEISYTNISEQSSEDILSVCNVKIHVLGAGHRFDLNQRLPVLDKASTENA